MSSDQESPVSATLPHPDEKFRDTSDSHVRHMADESAELENATKGYVVDAKHFGEVDDGHLKTAADGHTVLIPQPTEDPNDPLNWTFRKKNTILAVIAFLAFLPDYGSSMGAVTLIPQSM